MRWKVAEAGEVSREDRTDRLTGVRQQSFRSLFLREGNLLTLKNLLRTCGPAPLLSLPEGPKTKTMKYLLLLLLPLLTACSAKTGAYTNPDAYVDSRQNNGAPGTATAAKRKVLYTANLTVVVAEPDSAVARTVRLAETMGGFMSNTSSNSARIRVPAARFDEAMATIAAYGKLRTQYVAGQDVTDEFLDLGIRLENAEKSRARYLELLARAETVEATLAVERELERLNEVIDRYKGQRQRMDRLERFSTIDVNFPQRAKPGPLGYVFQGLYAGVRWLFVRR